MTSSSVPFAASATPASTHASNAALVVLLAATVSLQVARDAVAPSPAADPPTLWLQSPNAARRVLLSFTDLGADLYWIRAVIHYGGERRAPEEGRTFALLYPLLDIATSLDQRFDVAARLGAIFLSEGYPGGPGRPDQAIQLLEKGLANEPDRWQYRQDIGFVNYWWLQNYPEAARHFQMAADMPGGPAWMRTMAAVTLAKGGDRDSARTLWNELLTRADVDWIRRAANYGLQQLQALDEIDELRRRVATVTERSGRTPVSWADMVAAGALAGVPADPTGVSYALAPDGVVSLGADSTLRPLPTLEAHP